MCKQGQHLSNLLMLLHLSLTELNRQVVVVVVLIYMKSLNQTLC